jgi:GAF domain-containing protein
MIRIFCVGQDLLKEEQNDILASKDRNIVKFASIEGMIFRPEDRPDLIILDKDQSSQPSIKRFLALFNDVPKIIFSRTYPFKGLSRWIKVPYIYPVAEPSPKELEFSVCLALRDTRILSENASLKQRIENLSREIEFFDSVNKTLTSSLELNEVLDTIMKKAKKIINAEDWSILLIDKETGELVSQKTAKKTGERGRSKNYRLKPGEGIAGWVAREGVPVVIPDVSRDTRFCNQIGKETDRKTQSLICVPIRSKGNIVGVLEIVNRTKKRPFTREDLNLLMRLVDHAALAIERASLYQKMAELSVTDDLTKLFNTRYLNRTLEIEISRADRHACSLSLIFMDVDHFKLINDNYGHLVGSKLLVVNGTTAYQGAPHG